MSKRILIHLRAQQSWGSVVAGEAADYIEWLEDKIAAIQYTNLRRDMNLKNRTRVIDAICKEKKESK